MIRLKHLYWFIGFTLTAVTLFAALWKFGFEEILDPYLWGEHVAESPAERWEFVISAVLFVGLSMILPLLAGRNLIRQVAELEAREDAAVAGFNHNADAMFVTDPKRIIIAANSRCRDFLDGEPAQLIGRNFAQMIRGDTEDSAFVEMELALRKSGNWRGKINIYPDSTVPRAVFLSIAATRDELGNTTRFICVMRDVD